VTDEYGADLFLTVKFNPIPTRDHEAIKTAYKHLVYKVSLPAPHLRFYLYTKGSIQGIKFAGRTYEFLACSASQFREGQCLYFASHVESVDRPGRADLDAKKVRDLLGDFSKARSVAEYLSPRPHLSSSPSSRLSLAIPLSLFSPLPTLLSYSDIVLD
jgi:hypothetical protein